MMKIVRTPKTMFYCHEEISVPQYCCKGMKELMSYIGVGSRYLRVPDYSVDGCGSETIVHAIMNFCPFCGEKIEEEPHDQKYVIIGDDEDGENI